MTQDEEILEGLRLARQIFAGPNVSVAGGELAFSKYLSALRTVDIIIQNVEAKIEGVKNEQNIQGAGNSES